MVVIGLGKNLLFKSVLAHCDFTYEILEIHYFLFFPRILYFKSEYGAYFFPDNRHTFSQILKYWNLIIVVDFFHEKIKDSCYEINKKVCK